MSGHSLRRRLQQLEGRPSSPAQAQRALRAYHETGELPEHPRLRELVERVAAFSRAVRERRRTAPPGP